MNRQLNIILQLYLKKIILTVMLFGSLFLMYKMYSAFFDKVNYVWQKKYQYGFIEMTNLARHRLENAQFEYEFHCGGVSILKSGESEECKKAREEYEKAKAEYERILAKKDELLNVEKNVKDYYMSVARAARMFPLPALLFVFSLVVFIVLFYVFVKEFFKKESKEVEV